MGYPAVNEPAYKYNPYVNKLDDDPYKRVEHIFVDSQGVSRAKVDRLALSQKQLHKCRLTKNSRWTWRCSLCRRWYMLDNGHWSVY